MPEWINIDARLAPSLFQGISALRKMISSAGAAPAEVTMFLSANIPRDRLGASLHRSCPYSPLNNLEIVSWCGIVIL